ncbi:MAG: GatB/YqeY domain-containing protein [Rubellimicrobium sp.]|nr:GatB/YqeY domain-containing protein [Rubellimicrobium sp.]
MDLRERINSAIKEAMKAREADRLSTLRLVNAAFKDRDIAARGEGSDEPVGEEALVALLGKMVRQRQESARLFLEGGRVELAEKERAEIRVIEEFLPRQLSPEEVGEAIGAAIAETGAESIRDIGRVMAALKARHAGQMDFGQVGGLLRARLG